MFFFLRYFVFNSEDGILLNVNSKTHLVIKQEHAYSGIQVSPACRLDREMRRRLILQET